ncbi:Threonine--tRNA ligase [Bienertia sinuspersici]
MKSKGHGTFANKILQERAETWSKYAEDEDEYSRENEDYACESEGETSAKVYSMITFQFFYVLYV